MSEALRPQMTAYQSMLLIFSELAQTGKTILRQDKLVPTLYNCSNRDETKILFEDIIFNDNIDSITSLDIENSLVKLQTYGAIGRLNPAYEKIVIYINSKEASKLIQYFNTEKGEKFVEAAKIIANEFN